MTYDSKNKLLYNWQRKIKLSYQEHKLLILLSNNTLAKYEEIVEYIYNDTFEHKGNTLRALLKRFRDKTNLNIITRRNLGYVMINEIYYK